MFWLFFSDDLFHFFFDRFACYVAAVKPTDTAVKEKFEFETIEKEMPQLEQKKRELEEKLNSGIADHNELQSISEQIKNIVNELDQKSSRWLELSEVVI